MDMSLKDSYFTSIDHNIPFADYITRTQHLIKRRRRDLEANEALILDANSPFELVPAQSRQAHGNKFKYGALLIHGLLDSPFSLKDIGLDLQKQGVFSRAVLLPGHGTNPDDLLQVTFEEWLKIVNYGISSLKPLVENVFLIGYSTGAALAIHQLLKHHMNIAGMIMLSPAIKIKAPVEMVVAWHKTVNWISRDHTPWFYKDEEVDYAKYRSVTFNAVKQVAELTKINRNLSQKVSLNIPLLMILSREDDTISSHGAIQYFAKLQNPNSRLLLYTKDPIEYSDPRIITRPTDYPKLRIKQFSHVSIPFSPSNHHYGQQGDYIYASRVDNAIYGAYNRIESHAGDILYDLGLLKLQRHELTYNPDFEFMMENISKFILQDSL